MTFPRFQKVVMHILREEFGKEAHVSSWVNDIDYREYPVINVRRMGGYRSSRRPRMMDHPVVELTVYHDKGLIEAEEIYARCIDTLFRAWEKQQITPDGHLAYVRETMGMTQISSLYQDSWRIQGLIQIGIRSDQKEK